MPKKLENYTLEIAVKGSASKAFTALSQHVHLWWGATTNATSNVGDEFTVSFGDANWSFRVTDFVANAKITWECIGGNPDFNAEWIGDTLYWTIEQIGDTVKISLVQVGLTPDMNCYDICNAGWNFFITNSLQAFLETGVGNFNFTTPSM
ncbi:MAG: hypothetical protein COA50_05685 [Flavobacteriaceae bacterium]|nr:MAG: hypothetical protein COA50_05685 [Flavobacteriaceae bacterium]